MLLRRKANLSPASEKPNLHSESVQNIVGFEIRTWNPIKSGLYPYRVCKDIRSAHGSRRGLALRLSEMRSRELITTIGSQTRSTVAIGSLIRNQRSGRSERRKELIWRNRPADNYEWGCIEFEIHYMCSEWDFNIIPCNCDRCVAEPFKAKTYINDSDSHIAESEGWWGMYIWPVKGAMTDCNKGSLGKCAEAVQRWKKVCLPMFFLRKWFVKEKSADRVFHAIKHM